MERSVIVIFIIYISRYRGYTSRAEGTVCYIGLLDTYMPIIDPYKHSVNVGPAWQTQK